MTDLFGDEPVTDAKVDFYPTPLPVVMGFLQAYLPRPDRLWTLENNEIYSILDPGAGSGNISNALRMHGYRGDLTCVELRDEERPALTGFMPGAKVVIADFLQWEPDRRYGLAIGNPPFSLAREFAGKCFQCADRTALLLRLGYMATETRRKFWEEHPPSKIFIVTNRPSFTGSGTDSQEYAWFVWDGPPMPGLEWI